ncbi:MAG: S8 family serine peptidase [Gaiellaceae bacterium]
MGSWGVRVTVVLALLVGGLVRTVDSIGEPLPRAGSLESRLSQIADEVTAEGAASALQLADDLGVPVAAGRVRVVLQPAAGNAATARAAVTVLGGTVEAEAAGLIQALVPGHALRALPGVAGGAVVRTPLTPQPAAITGEGVASTKADVWHRAGLDGSGTDVAVIDVGFSGLAARQAEGEVSASAVRVDHCPGRWESTDHGVAVAEVVQEVAPGARLHLICVGTEIELAQALDYVVANGIAIVNHSGVWFASSRGDGQGPPGTPEHTVARARAAGILWVNAAGNASEKHWSGLFTDVDANGRHEFASGDERNRVTLNAGRVFCSSLKWDEWPATDENFDLYLRTVAGDVQIASSTTVQNGSQMPREEVCWQNNAPAPVDVYVEIRRAGGASSPRLDLYSLVSGKLQHQTPEGSVIEPATSPAALAVGAVCWPTNTLEYYSSRGPTIDGRVKPDLVAPANVSGATYGRFQDCDPLTTVAFRGTSAAAPHVAAAAALLKQARPQLSPDGLIAALLADTTDLGAPGFDFLHGAGSYALRPLAPVVINAPASLGVRYATVAGSIDTRSLTTSYVIEYGPTGTELRSAPASLPPAAGPTPLSVTLEGLAPGASFRYRIVATNAFGSTPGELVSASTLTPSAPALAATLDVGERSATITVTVDPRGDPTTLLAEYGTTSGYGSRIGPIDVGRGAGPRTLSVELTGLEPGSTYHFRVVAANPAGTTGTPDATLTTRTPPPPPAPPDLALSLTAAPQVVTAGGGVTYRAIVANRGGSVATGVRLVLALPRASTIQRSSADHGGCQAQAESLTCELGNLLSGETATAVAETRPAGGEATAEVTLDQRDGSMLDNQASLRITIVPATRAAATLPSLRLTSVQRPRGTLRRGRREITTGFALNRPARVTVTLLDANGRRVPLLAGSGIGGLFSKKTSAALERSLPSGRSVAILRHRELSQRKPLKVKLVARDSTGKRITLLLTVRR